MYKALYTGEGSNGHTVLRDVRSSDGELLADHLWVPRQHFACIPPGRIVTFTARVAPYVRRDGTMDYNLAGIRRVRPTDEAAL